MLAIWKKSKCMNCFPIQSFHTIALKSGNSYHIVHIFVEIFSKKNVNLKLISITNGHIQVTVFKLIVHVFN